MGERLQTAWRPTTATKSWLRALGNPQPTPADCRNSQHSSYSFILITYVFFALCAVLRRVAMVHLPGVLRAHLLRVAHRALPIALSSSLFRAVCAVLRRVALVHLPGLLRAHLLGLALHRAHAGGHRGGPAVLQREGPVLHGLRAGALASLLTFFFPFAFFSFSHPASVSLRFCSVRLLRQSTLRLLSICWRSRHWMSALPTVCHIQM